MAFQKYFNGQLDQMRWFKRKLSDEDFQKLIAEYEPPPTPELPTGSLDYWYDADDGATVSGTDDNYSVSNKGAASTPLVANVAPSRYGVVTLNGKPLFSIDTSQFLSNNPNRAWRFSAEAGKTINSGSTVYLAGTWQNNALRAWATRDLSGLNSELFTDPGYRIYSGGTFQDFGSGWMVSSICVIKNNKVWVNNALQCEISGVTLPSTTDSGSADALLCPSSTGITHNDGTGEVCVYNDPALNPGNPSDTKHQAIMAYLSWKWGITLP